MALLLVSLRKNSMYSHRAYELLKEEETQLSFTDVAQRAFPHVELQQFERWELYCKLPDNG
jgi:hypothetical protein